MKIHPTQSGRSLHGDTPWGAWNITIDLAADGKDCKIVDPDGNVVGSARMTFREPSPAVPPTPGPGDHLHDMLASVGLTGSVEAIEAKTACQRCKDLQEQMNRWGVAGCRQHRQEIIDHLVSQAGKLGWTTIVFAGAKSTVVLPGLAAAYMRGGWTGAAEWLVDDAIRRAEAAK